MDITIEKDSQKEIIIQNQTNVIELIADSVNPNITVVISQVGEKGDKGDAGLTPQEIEGLVDTILDSKFTDAFGVKL